MAAVTQPTLIPRPWASNGGAREDIPDTTTQFGRASWSKGFPSETAQPLAAGGIPPNWLDFQGVLYALSQHAVFEQAGGHYTWSNTVNYPANAIIVGSNGTLYKALQESGPGTTAGAKNPTSSSNTSYWGVLATPDGQTIKVVNGKLTVDLDNLADALADGTTITASGGKLTSVGGSDASSLADNITTVANNGKLSVDLTNVTAAALKKITQHEIDSQGGLVMDSSTGLLSVDFDAMPLDRIEKLLKSLKMLIPLSSNKTFYVDTNNPAASDTLDDGRGTAAKPFKTISACTNYVTATYSLGQYHITIRVVAGTYNEIVSLPDFAHGAGYIAVRSDSGQRDVIINAQAYSSGLVGPCFNASGGDWRLYYMDARRVENPTTAKAQTPSVYYANNGAILRLYGCSAKQSMPSSPSPLGGENYTVRVFEADNGATIRFEHSVLAGSVSVQKPSSGTPEIHVLAAERGGTILLTKAYDSSNDPTTTNEIVCTGSCDYFLRLRQGGYVKTISSGDIITFTTASSFPGKKYELSDGSSAAIGEGTSFLPGTTAGTVDSSTYCWYN